MTILTKVISLLYSNSSYKQYAFVWLYPNVVVPKTDSGLSKDSVVIIPLVTTVNKFAFIEKISVMPKSYMKEINKGLIEIFELQGTL